MCARCPAGTVFAASYSKFCGTMAQKRSLGKTLHLYGESIDTHVLDFKWRGVDFGDLFGDKIFGLQLFIPIESFPIRVSGIRPW